MVSIAGILANLLIAICGFTIFKVLVLTPAFGFIPESLREPVFIFLEQLIIMNVSLAVFNLLPFPPLDGSKVLETFLPASAQPVLAALEQHGYIILMLLMYMGVTGAIIRPVIRFVYYLMFLGIN
jgi:Zn-dependent protease